MSIFSWLHDRLFGDYSDHTPEINPATGLPMVGSVDIEGNPYGMNNDHWTASQSSHDHWSSHSSYDDWSRHDFGSSDDWHNR